jgi:3D (Asp-Asp-Asp) domain-containing protein
MIKKLIVALVAMMGVFFLGTGNAQAEWVTMEATAYTHTGNPTASGEWPYVGGVAFNYAPLGSRIMIDGIWYVVNDRSGASGIVDIFMDTYEECMAFGRQYKEVWIER